MSSNIDKTAIQLKKLAKKLKLPIKISKKGKTIIGSIKKSRK